MIYYFVNALLGISEIAALGTIFNIFSYDVVLTENQTHHLPNSEA